MSKLILRHCFKINIALNYVGINKILRFKVPIYNVIYFLCLLISKKIYHLFALFTPDYWNLSFIDIMNKPNRYFGLVNLKFLL